MEAAQQQSGREGHQDGDERRGNDAQVEILQGLDVSHDARQQVAATILEEPGRGQRFERGVEPDPQPGQQAEGDVMRDRALQVAEDAAGNAEKANADDGHLKIGDGRSAGPPGR